MADYYSEILRRMRTEEAGERSRRKSIYSTKSRLLMDPNKMDELAAALTSQLSPVTKKAKKGKFALKSDAVDSVIPSDHPMKGFVYELRDNLGKMLRDPRNVQFDTADIAHTTAMHMLTATPGGGAPRWLQSYEYKRREDAELIPIGKRDLRAPLFGELPSYEAWLDFIKNKEDRYYNYYKEGGKVYKKGLHEKLLASPTELGVAAGAGGVVGGLIGGPVGVAAGVPAAVAGEIIAKPLRSGMEKTEWYRASASPLMMSNRFLDRAKGLGILAIPEIIAGGTVDVSLFKALRVPLKVAGTRSTASALTAARKETNANFQKLLKDKSFLEKMKLRFTHSRDRKLGWSADDLLFMRTLKKAVGRGDKRARNVLHNLGRAASEAETARMYMPRFKSKISGEEFTTNNLWYKLDQEAQEYALNHESGSFVKGVFEAYERQEARHLAIKDGWMKDADELIGLRSREATKGIDVAAGEVFNAFDKSVRVVPEEFIQKRTLAETFKAKKGMKDIVAMNPHTAKAVKLGRDLPKEFKAGKGMKSIMAESLDSLEADENVRRVINKTSEPTARTLEMGEPEPLIQEAVVQAKQLTRGRGRSRKKKVTVETATGKRIAPEDQVEEAKRLAEKYPVVGEEGMKSEVAEGLVNEYGRMFTEGEITAEETLRLMVRLQNDVMMSAEKTMTNQGAMDFERSTYSFMRHLRSIVGNKALYAMLGVGAPTISMFLGAEPAEAGFLKSVVKGMKNVADVGATELAIMRKMRKAKYNIDTIIPDDQYLIQKEGFQTGLKDLPGATSGPSWIRKNIDQLGKRGIRESSRWFFMTPFQVAEEVFMVGKSLMNNPAVWRASFQAAEYNNSVIGRKVFSNILREAGIKSERNEVRARFKPLIGGMVDQVEYGWRKSEIEKLNKEYNSFKKIKTQEDAKEFDLELNRSTVDEHVKRLGEMEGSIEKYHKDFAEIAEQAAAEIPSVRVTLALDDTPDFKKYPFLKKIDFHPDEQTAIGRIRQQLMEYKARLDEMKVPTIKGPYAPHILHPEFTAKMFEDITGDTTAAAYLRFYRRSPESRPLFPDIENTLMRYVSDLERRIQNNTFLDQNWKEVRKRSGHIPGAKLIFDTLEEGMRPMDQTVANNAANIYTQFEVFKRLFLSPSAGGKHLVKMSASIVEVGPSKVAEVLPLAAVYTAKRILRANPTIRKALSNMGLKSTSEQDKLVTSYMRSTIPARGARQRMLDIGLNTPEEYYTGIKNVWHKVQNIGGAWINLAELVDRGVSVLTASNLVAKRGLTIEQGIYGAYDLVLRNNFLSREMNPKWLRNPKVRAALMFQGTPYKILERRVVNAIRAGRSVKAMGKAVKEATKTPEGRMKLLRDLTNLKADVKAGEAQAKVNIFAHALMQETDFFGNPMVGQFVKDVLMIGAATIGGGYAGMNLMHHFFHLPFVSGVTYDPGISLAISPALRATVEGWQAYKEREEADDDFLFIKIMQRWLGPYGPLPEVMRKYDRLSENDIPERYDDSKFKYIFAIPAKGHH